MKQDNFGEAQQRSTKLFDGVRATLFASQNETVRYGLEVFLQHRDDVTASLTAAKPSTADMLHRLDIEFAGEDGEQKRLTDRGFSTS